MTGATELEFWVKTPEDKADRQQLSTSQELKEQYWQRTRTCENGPGKDSDFIG